MRLKYLMQQKSIANLCIQAVNDKVECFMVMAINGNIPYISIHPPLYCLTVPDSRIHFKLAARFQESPPDSHPLTHTHTHTATNSHPHSNSHSHKEGSNNQLNFNGSSFKGVIVIVFIQLRIAARNSGLWSRGVLKSLWAPMTFCRRLAAY